MRELLINNRTMVFMVIAGLLITAFILAVVLCLALHKKKDTGDIREKMQEARDTLFLAEHYMDELGKEFESLRMKKLTDKQVMEYIEILLPIEDGSTPQQEKNMKRLREDMKIRYFDAPDLQGVGKNAYRFVNAVSDFATHAEPLRKTANYKENLFSRTVYGNPVIDKAYQIVCAA